MSDRFRFTPADPLRQYAGLYPQAAALLADYTDLSVPLGSVADPVALQQELARTCRLAPIPADPEWAQCGISELIEHLTTGHHTYLFAELGRLQVLVDHLGQPTISTQVLTWSDEVCMHMLHEEAELFPLCLAAETDREAVLDEELHGMYRGHEETEGDLVAICEALSEISGHQKLLNTIQTLLVDVISDLHVHIELEDTVLLPAVRFEQDLRKTRQFRKSQVLRALQPKVGLKAAEQE
jgi:iron-sulfur cluster repair protein YtfE (RIC family)